MRECNFTAIVPLFEMIPIYKIALDKNLRPDRVFLGQEKLSGVDYAF
jgi:hypothetical protein